MPSPSSIITRNVPDIAIKTGNIYQSINVIAKRARQLSSKQKEELTTKLADFASTVDNLEEVFENREQIEISKYYERMPKPTIVAIDEFMDDKLVYTEPEFLPLVRHDEMIIDSEE
ncbi:MAG: DNA-directed RNA polymerase subunit omega [Thermoflexibacter sp.]|jgi:DNA-directed RNA polymerase subunit K/omega|nr:DNA-directed RNA polymerase subunit omega [Thermoflexibacter sp.]